MKFSLIVERYRHRRQLVRTLSIPLPEESPIP